MRRIAAGDKRTPFLGSDFYYEDISGRGIEVDHHEITEVSDNYFVIKNTPTHPGSVEFSHYKMWIHRQTFVPVKVEFYDKKGDKAIAGKESTSSRRIFVRLQCAATGA